MAEVTEAQSKLGSVLRHGGTAAGTLFTLFGALQFVTPEQVAQLTAAVHDFNESIISAYGALTKMWVIIGPVGIYLIGKAGWNSASIKGISQKLMAIATGPAGPAAIEAQKAVIEVTTAVALDPAIPKSTEAKAALIDAVAAQPEVVGKISVTDKTLVDATNSSQVQKVS